MKPSICCMSAIVLLAASAVANADAKSEAAARTKAVAPFVEANTAIVVHIDAARADPASALDFLARFIPVMPNELAAAEEKAVKGLQRAIPTGVKEYFVVVTLGNEGWMPKVLIVIPVRPEPDPAEIVLYPGEPTVPFGKFHAVARPELAAAFEAAGDAAIQVILIPPVYTARVIEELLPQFPKQLGGGPTTILTRGVLWAAAGIDLRPHLGLRLTIKSANAQSAEAFRTKLAEMIRLGGACEEVRSLLPKFAEAAAVFAPKVEGDRLVLVLNEQNQGVDKLLSLVTPPIEVMRAGAARLRSRDNLMGIALAMHSYYNANKHFPLPASLGKDGKPLLSWRVHILAFTDENSLFKQFHLNEPWDSPHNRTLIDKMPSIYRMPMSKTEKGRTNYLLPVGGGAVFEANKPTTFKDITDGTSNTIMTVEADDEHAAIWTKPEDLQFDPNDPMKGLGHFYKDGFNLGFCDGSAHYLTWPKDAKQIETLRYLFQRADRNPVYPW